MKTILILLTAIVTTLPAIAAEPAVKKPDWWTYVSVTPFGALTRPNLTDRPVYGAGIDIGYNINPTVSIHVSNLGFENQDWRGSAIDETSILFRADLVKYSDERVVGYLIGGADKGWGKSGRVSNEDWAFGVGVGLERRFSKNVAIGFDSRIRAWFKQDKDWITRGFVSFKF